MYSNRYTFQTLMELEYSRQILEKYSYSKFHENPPVGAMFSVQTDGHDETTSSSPQFCGQNVIAVPSEVQLKSKSSV